MKALCLVLLLGLTLPGCSSFSKQSRTERAYYKHLKQAKAAREKQRDRILKEKSRIPSPNAPPPLPLNVQPRPPEQTVQPSDDR
jgi:hypothetical protein